MLVSKKKVLLLSILGSQLTAQDLTSLPKKGIRPLTPVAKAGDTPKAVGDLLSAVGGPVVFKGERVIQEECIDSDSDEQARVVPMAKSAKDDWSSEEEESDLDFGVTQRILALDVLRRVAEYRDLSSIKNELGAYAQAPASPVAPQAAALTVVTSVPSNSSMADPFALHAASTKSGTTYSSARSADSRELSNLFSPGGKKPVGK